MREEQAELQSLVRDVSAVADTLNPANGSAKEREARFHDLAACLEGNCNPVRNEMARTMHSFAPGLFVGGDDPDFPHDNLDLERFFRIPKGHERRIHGHRHAGVRIVVEGATLLPTLDAHARHEGLFDAEELVPYAQASPPLPQQRALHRRRIMRKARSNKQRPLLLRELEQRYAGCG